MAKDFMSSWEAPHFRERPSFPWGSVLSGIAIIAVIIIIGFLVSNIQKTPDVESSIQATEQTSQDVIPATEITVAKATSADIPSISEKCDVVAGVVPGSVSLNADNVVKVIFKNNGKKTIEGSYFEFSGEAGKAYMKNEDVVDPDNLVSYELDLDDISLELGVAVRTFVILPIQDGKACLNQRMVVIGND